MPGTGSFIIGNVIMVISLMTMSYIHPHMPAGDAAAVYTFNIYRILVRDLQSVQTALPALSIESQIEESPQNHIAADPRKTVKIGVHIYLLPVRFLLYFSLILPWR